MDREATMRSLIGGDVYVIAWWDDPKDKKINFQDFYAEGLHYIPIFSSEATAKEQTKDTPYEKKVVRIRGSIFFPLFRGDELLILNPKDGLHQQFRASEFQSLMAKR